MALQGDSGVTGCRLIGQPEVEGAFTFTLTAQDNGQTPAQFASQSITVTID
jgi:hypothetical protein